MRLVRRINEQGIWQEDVILKDDEEMPNDCTSIPYDGGLILPKLDKGEWVEGLTQEEIDTMRNVREPVSETQKLWDMIDYLVNSSYE